MALSATANAELKVATVDVQKLFADYYKTHEAQAEVDKAAQTVQETNNTRAETIKKMEADFNDMVKRLQDPMLNEKDKNESAFRQNHGRNHKNHGRHRHQGQL